MNVSLSQIKAFYTVARVGSIKAAAAALNLSQPAVSARIKQLEEELEFSVFKRTAKGVHLSIRGRELLVYAEKMLKLNDDLLRSMKAPSDYRGNIVIGTSETVAQTWMVHWIDSIQKTMPLLEIEIVVDVSINLREMLLDREIDVAVMLGPVTNYSIVNVELPPMEMAWYASERLGARKMAELIDDYPIATFSKNTAPFRQLRRQLAQNEQLNPSFIHSSSLAVCRKLVADEMAIAVLPCAYVGDDLACQRMSVQEQSLSVAPLQFVAAYLDETDSAVPELCASLASEVAHQDIKKAEAKP